MKRSLSCLILVVCFCACALGQTGSCAKNTWYSLLYYDTASGTQEHYNGMHDYHAHHDGNCIYTTPLSSDGYCTSHSNAETVIDDKYDNGVIWNPYAVHEMAFNSGPGQAVSIGGEADSDTQGVFGVRSCLITCSITISVGGGSGIPFFFTFNPPNPIFSASTAHYWQDCAPMEPVLPSGPPGGSGGTPLIVDTKGTGFHFTDLKHCILYDIGDGKVRCYSWPQHGSGNGWLVLDFGPGEDIQMLGNFSPHADDDYAVPGTQKASPPNGFIALGYYGQRTRSGIIDKNDCAWSTNPDPSCPKLKVWIDDHCYLTPQVQCSALRSELHVLDEFGWPNISYVYSRSNIRDKEGNQFAYWAQADPDVEHHEPQKPRDPMREMRISDVIPVYQ